VKINVDEKMYNLDGDVLQENGRVLTLGRVMAQAFNLTGQGVPNDIKPEERGLLAFKMFGAKGEVDLTTEEVAACKKLIALRYVPIVVAQANALLEGKDNPATNS
jgi:hypothetical protein